MSNPHPNPHPNQRLITVTCIIGRLAGVKWHDVKGSGGQRQTSGGAAARKTGFGEWPLSAEGFFFWVPCVFFCAVCYSSSSWRCVHVRVPVTHLLRNVNPGHNKWNICKAPGVISANCILILAIMGRRSAPSRRADGDKWRCGWKWTDRNGSRPGRVPKSRMSSRRQRHEMIEFSDLLVLLSRLFLVFWTKQARSGTQTLEFFIFFAFAFSFAFARPAQKPRSFFSWKSWKQIFFLFYY